MNYRTAELLVGEDVGASGTKVIDVNVSKPISQIDITFKTTKASQGMSAGSPANISKIELVDGSKRLFSLSGYEAQALAYYSRPGIVCDHGQHISTLSEFDTFPILFGRHLWDKELAFDPTKFVNPQLRITYDEDVSDTSVSANELEVWAHIFDELAISPIGFLSAVEHYDYTCGAADSYETIELPDDRAIRQILVRAYQDGYEPWYQIDEARLDEGTLAKLVWEFTNLENYYRRMKAQWPLIVQQVCVLSDTGGVDYYVAPTDYYSGIVGMGMSSTAEVYHDGAASRGGKLSITGSANVHYLGLVFGYLPWHCYQFPMGLKDDIEDWYDPKGKKPRLRLRASTGATSGTGEVVLEELYRY
jgi:hypothetical protein